MEGATYEVWLESCFSTMYFWKNDHTIEISGQTSEELTPRRGTKSNRLRFDPYCLKFNPLNNRIYTSGYRIRIRSYTRKQDCHGQLPAFLSKLAGDLFLFLSAFSTRESQKVAELLSMGHIIHSICMGLRDTAVSVLKHPSTYRTILLFVCRYGRTRLYPMLPLNKVSPI